MDAAAFDRRLGGRGGRAGSPSCRPSAAGSRDGRVRSRRVLAMFDYPPEEEREAVDLVLKQTEIVALTLTLAMPAPRPPASGPLTGRTAGQSHT